MPIYMTVLRLVIDVDFHSVPVSVLENKWDGGWEYLSHSS